MTQQEQLLSELYNLILNQGTRDWERSQLLLAKENLAGQFSVKTVLDNLEKTLRPLALRHNLTPDVMDFYLELTNDANQVQFDVSQHQSLDLPFQEVGVFAGGCFWCMVEPFETMTGILSVLSGYTGGTVDNPTYDQVCSGKTGHTEAVEIIFDNRKIHYEELVDYYWQLTDPTDAFGQFQDRGSQYRPVIFVQNQHQRAIAEESKDRLANSGEYRQPIVTEICDAQTFWPAENYHQEFYKKEPKRYQQIKKARHQLANYQAITTKMLKKSHSKQSLR